MKNALAWPIVLDGKNDPMLPQASEFKVMFETNGPTKLFQAVVGAFDSGNLLGVSIGQAWSDKVEPHTMVIKVLPSGP